VDDATALRLKKIELSLHATERSADVQAHRSIAMLAVAATFGTSSALAGLVKQVPAEPAALAAGFSVAIILLQLRTLQLIARRLDQATAEALQAIDTLISSGGESDAHGQADAGGA
jgi:hypothetical protein